MDGLCRLDYYIRCIDTPFFVDWRTFGVVRTMGHGMACLKLSAVLATCCVRLARASRSPRLLMLMQPDPLFAPSLLLTLNGLFGGSRLCLLCKLNEGLSRLGCRHSYEV